MLKLKIGELQKYTDNYINNVRVPQEIFYAEMPDGYQVVDNRENTFILSQRLNSLEEVVKWVSEKL